MTEVAQTEANVLVEVTEDGAILKTNVYNREFELHCDKDTPLGVFHDVLMLFKGWCVDRIITHHEKELINTAQVKSQDAAKYEDTKDEEEA